MFLSVDGSVSVANSTATLLRPNRWNLSTSCSRENVQEEVHCSSPIRAKYCSLPGVIYSEE